jgi:hypothetical protein
MSHQLDLSDYSNAEEAAKAIEERLEKVALSLNQMPSREITFVDNGDHYIIRWPGGTERWTDIVSGSPILGAEPEIVGLDENKDILVEVKNEDSIVIRND